MSPDGSCIVKLNSNGNIIWQTDFQTILFPPDYKSIEIKDGDIYVGGEIIKDRICFYIEKFDKNGNSLGNNIYGISDWNQFCDMALKDGVIVMGTSLGNVSLVKFSIEGLKLGKEEERNKGIPGFEIIFVIGAIILAIRKFNH